jgi:selenide, water dikinase
MNAPTTPAQTQPRLTSLSHGGGCGCKIAPGVLAQILKGTTALPVPPQLLVGIETADDAAVYQLNDEQALIATTDFFMPIVDDPYEFGRIAATNAISDVYAMGGRPIMALALVAMPIAQLSTETIGASCKGATMSAAQPASRSPVATPSIPSSPSMAWWPWAWCTPSASSATPTRRWATA